MKGYQLKSWILEFRDIFKNYNFLLDSCTKLNSVGSLIHIFLHQERFIKLLDPRTLSILLNSLKLNRMIKGVVFFIIVVLLYCINNRNMIESKNLYLTGIFPVPFNLIGPINDTFEESFLSYNINRFILSILYLSKTKSIPKSCFIYNNNTWTKKPEYNWGSRWCRNWIKKGNVNGIEISLKLEFTFFYYMDNPIHDWVLFDRMKRTNKERILEIKDFICYLMCTFKIPNKVELKQQNYGSIIQSKEILSINKWSIISFQNCFQFYMWQLYKYLFIGWDNNLNPHKYMRYNWVGLYNLLVNNFSNIRASNNSSQLYYYQSMDPLYSINNINSEYCTLINQNKIQQLKEILNLKPEIINKKSYLFKKKYFSEYLRLSLSEEVEKFLRNPTRSIHYYFSDRWPELNMVNRFTITINNHKLLKKERFVQSEMVNILRIIKNSVTISSDPRYYMYEPYSSLLNKNKFIYLFNLLYDGGYHYFELKVKKILDLFILSIIEPVIVYHNKLKISYVFYKKNVFNLPPIFYEKHGSPYIRNIRIKKVSIYRRNNPIVNRTIIKYIINKHFKLGVYRSMNQDPRYKWAKGNNNLQEHKANILHNWFEVIYKKYLYLSKCILFLSNSLPFLFVNLGNITIYKSEIIHIHESKDLNDQFYNQLLKSIGFKIIHFNKPFLLGYIDSLNINNCVKSFDNMDSLKRFNESSLISCFYKENKLRFLHNRLYFNKILPFYVENINKYDGEFLNILLKKNYEKDNISPIEPKISNTIISGPFIFRAFYSGIFLKKIYNKSISDKNIYQYLRHTPFLLFEKHKNHNFFLFCINKCVDKDHIFKFKLDSALSKWKLFRTYMPCFFTSAGYKYINFLFLDTFYDLNINKFFVSIFNDIMYGSNILCQIFRITLWKANLNNSISNISIKCLQKLIYRNNKSPWIYQRSPTVREFLYSILFFIIVAGYIIRTHIFFFFRAYSELRTEFEKVKIYMIESYIIELNKLMYRYPASELWLKNIFLVALEQLYYNFFKDFSVGNMIFGKYFNINLMDLINIIPNPIIKISFYKNTRYISHTSKEIYSSIIKKVNDNGIYDKIESWAANSNSIDEEEKEFLIQFYILTAEKKSINKIILSLTYSDHLSNNFEQPGTIYLRYLVDIHKKCLINYEFNISCLAERRIFLAHYQTITYYSHRVKVKPFSLLLAPSKGVLVIGSIGTCQYFLAKYKYIVTNSYIPLITIFLVKFLDNNPKLIDDSDEFYAHENSYRDIDMELELLTMINSITSNIMFGINQFFITLQFELAKVMSPCIIWIPNIHDLDVNLGILVNYIYRDCERCSSKNILVIASTHIPKKVDPAIIAPNKFNACIKIRSLPISRNNFFTLSYTRGFYLENKENKNFYTNGIWPQDLVALTNEALSISITQNKSIIETNIIRSSLHRQTWYFQSQVGSVHDYGIFFYQIGRYFAQNILLINCTMDPISIYIKKKSYNDEYYHFYKFYFELGMSMNKLMILLYILSCSAGSVAQDFWYIPRITYYFIENDIVHDLLEVEGAIASSRNINNDRVALLGPSKPLQNGSTLEEVSFIPQHLEEDLLNHIVWAPRIWYCIERPTELGLYYWSRIYYEKDETDSELFKSVIMEYQTLDISSYKEQGFFRISQFIWDPVDPLFFLLKYQLAFSHFEDMKKELITITIQMDTDTPTSIYKRWFINNMQEKHFELLIHCRLIKNNISFRSNILYESYEYLSKIFISNGMILDQMTKILLKKKWLFPDEIKFFFTYAKSDKK
uniref:Protein Ycf2 n=1 Tax=Cynomorium coccineum TaxID=51503 RepID=A0A1B1FBU7_9MAGN|nr:Ycf2 [Cynomorium coccineum]ANQ38697.1 Ycf2 [Cynomorium coccineum]ANS54317.1 Ycf2 [Cynomorium coccineum]